MYELEVGVYKSGLRAHEFGLRAYELGLGIIHTPNAEQKLLWPYTLIVINHKPQRTLSPQPQILGLFTLLTRRRANAKSQCIVVTVERNRHHLQKKIR